MQINDAPTTRDLLEETDEDYRGPRPLDLSKIVSVIRSNRQAIVLTWFSVLLIYLIGALALYLFMPASHTTRLMVRLEFSGADQGRYPNGSRFTGADIVANSVLTRVFHENQLSRFFDYSEFKKSVFIVEANEAAEMLAREYRSRLTDPRLDAILRAEIEQEYQSKRASLRHADFELNLTSPAGAVRVHPKLAQKVLNDILRVWAEQAERERGVLQYDQTMLTRNILDPTILSSYDYIIAVDILRSKVAKISRNIEVLMSLPGAAVTRTGPEQISLAELRLRLADLIQYRIEPLLGQIIENGLSRNPQKTIQFFESQLRYNALERTAADARVATLQAAYDTYSGSTRRSVEAVREGASTPTTQQPLASGSTVIPTLGETFLDRLVKITEEASDLEYRQNYTERLANEALAAIPLRTEEEYYTSIIQALKGFEVRARSARPDEAATLSAEMNGIYQELIRVIDVTNVLAKSLSKNLNAASEMFSTSQPSSGVERSVSIKFLAILGILIALLAFPLIVVVYLLVERLRNARPDEFQRTRGLAATETATPSI